ncbi:hypothetical protein [Polaribacter ponticola]|uniref:Uncharacterized protein n=1 Tax=Polaribacter ponticola TaxID=2978475 RepID=A0ABT5S489_9FLAO|nr:hypothetical protein [Polaribacter sp. MSW5]MDD7912923.1 hypothetical protein [Polaribacter sp. MSW5]
MAFYDTINTGTTPNDGQGDGLRTNIRKLHDNTKDNKQRLDDLNGNTPGVVAYNDCTLLVPIDGNKHLNSAFTGALKITLPYKPSNCLGTIVIDVINYSVNTSFTLIISAHLGLWENSSCTILGNNTVVSHVVRLGFENNLPVIYIGELNTNWTIPSIAVRNLFVSRGQFASINWLTGWNISSESGSFQNLAKTHSNNLPVAQ